MEYNESLYELYESEEQLSTEMTADMQYWEVINDIAQLEQFSSPVDETPTKPRGIKVPPLTLPNIDGDPT